MGIIIKEVTQSHIPQIKNIVKHIWAWEEMSESEEVLNATLTMYMNNVLYDSTYGRAAFVDGKMVGVIFGIMNGQYPKYRMMVENSMNPAIALINASNNERKAFSEYMTKINAAYAQLLKGKENNYDGTLNFLVLSKEARGLGIGKKLWLTLAEHFKSHKAKSIYVYTDSDCNFKFYEHLGFNKAGALPITIDIYGKPYSPDIFMYDYDF